MTTDGWCFAVIATLMILCAGTPDLLDAITVRVFGGQVAYEQFQKEIGK